LLVRNLALALRGEHLPVALLDINEQIHAVVNLLAHKLAHLEVRLELATHLPNIAVSDIEIKQILMNLIKNAAEATPKDGTLCIITKVARACVIVQIRDTGTGITKEHREDIFSLNFSTKGKGENSGVGLYAVKSLVQHIGGKIAVASATCDKDGQLVAWRKGFRLIDRFSWTAPGTVFRIELPIAQEE
jgi:signal transduction histidine kinase